jgi:D-lactate dehydrogenase
MDTSRPFLAVFDAKPYDREYLSAASQGVGFDLRFHEFRLEHDTSSAAAGAKSVCVFVNDVADRITLESLAALGVGHLALRCAGYNNVDLKAAKETGIFVTRVPSYSPYAVAEHAVALLMTLNRKIHRSYNRVREFNFSLAGLVGFDLYDKTVGVVGTGKTGRLLAEILRGFKMRVLAHDLYPNEEWARANQVEYVPLDRLFQESDVISLHAPLTPESAYLINGESLARMKRGVVIVNVSRGRLIETTSLIEALKSGQVGGVALDVYEEEEGVFFEDLSGEVLQDDELARLMTFPNVLITAHQAFLTHEALSEISRVTVANVGNYLSGTAFLEGTQL